MPTTEDRIAEINAAVERLLNNQLDVLPLDVPVFPPGLTPLAQNMNQLQQYIRQLREFSLLLAQGDLDASPPARRNYLASSLKQLQAQLRHLTWQTQRVADGDYRQVVDFMGDFALAFNTMIRQLHTRETDLAAQRDAMKSVFDNIEPIVIVDADHPDRAIYTNHKANARFLIEGEDLELARSRTPFLCKVLAVPEGQRRDLFDEDSERWYTVVASSLPWSSGIPSILYHCMDITAHKMREMDLSYAAHTDELTGLSNRRAFEGSFARVWQQCQTNAEPLSLFMVDIDLFKKCNDVYGHLHGDKCLKSLAKALLFTVSRSSDVVARFGGEEFVVLLPSTDKYVALQLAESMRLSVQALKIGLEEQPDVTTSMTISVGVTSAVPSDGMLPKRCLAIADEALYEAKQSGRNRVVFKETRCP